MKFEIWIWKQLTSEGAEIYEVIDADDAQDAAFAAMQEHQLPYAHYTWVSPAGDGWDAAEFYHLQCPGVRAPGH